LNRLQVQSCESIYPFRQPASIFPPLFLPLHSGSQGPGSSLSRDAENSVSTLWLLLIIRHFADRTPRFCELVSFFSVVSGWRAGCIHLLCRWTGRRSTCASLTIRRKYTFTRQRPSRPRSL